MALLAGGALLGEGAARARSVLWLLAVLAWTGVAVVVLTEVIERRSRGQVARGLGRRARVRARRGAWWVERRSLQLIAMLASGTLALAAIAYTEQAVSVLGFDVGQGIPDPTWSAVVIMVIGAAALATGIRGLFAPRRSAMVLGSLWLIGGAYFVDIDTDVLGGDVGTSTLALAIALAASVAVIVVGNLWEDRAVAGIEIVRSVVRVDGARWRSDGGHRSGHRGDRARRRHGGRGRGALEAGRQRGGGSAGAGRGPARVRPAGTARPDAGRSSGLIGAERRADLARGLEDRGRELLRRGGPDSV